MLSAEKIIKPSGYHQPPVDPQILYGNELQCDNPAQSHCGGDQPDPFLGEKRIAPAGAEENLECGERNTIDNNKKESMRQPARKIFESKKGVNEKDCCGGNSGCK